MPINNANTNITRRNGREWALQLLFQLDTNPSAADVPFEQTAESFWGQQWQVKKEAAEKIGKELKIDETKSDARRVAPDRMREFTEDLVRGVLTHQTQLDEKIEACMKNWAMYRLGIVERNVLRLALFELFHTETPPPVIINEAVDLTKYFSTTEAGRFVNGILDKIRKDLGK